MAPYAQAFVGVLVDSERDAHRDAQPAVFGPKWFRVLALVANMAFLLPMFLFLATPACIFQPWLNGPHNEVYKGLLNGREWVKEITGDIQIAAVVDRSIIAVADVIMRCAKRREELGEEGLITNG